VQLASLSDLSRLSLNQMTIKPWSIRDVVEGCVRAGIPALGLWRESVAETGLRASARLVADAGLRVSSLCRGGWFGAATAGERKKRLDDNRRAIDEAAVLGTNVLVLVCGPAADRQLEAARAYVEEAIASLLPYAVQCGVRLGIEPLHPMYAAERSVIVTLAEANALVRRLNSVGVGVVIDVYHVWWDPEVYIQISAATGHILGFHVCDWLVPTTDLLLSRAMMGDGVIELRRLRAAVEAAGYRGPIEVEIFNQEIWQLPGDEILRRVCTRYMEHV
jgi:sugar phosphate isomerase/epimerase